MFCKPVSWQIHYKLRCVVTESLVHNAQKAENSSFKLQKKPKLITIHWNLTIQLWRRRKKRVLEMCYSSGCTHPGIAHHWLTKAAKKSFASLSVAESKAVVEAHQLQQHLSFESWFHKVHWIWKDGNFVETQESCARYSTKNLEAWTCVCRSLCLWGHSTDHQSQPTGGSLAIQTSPSHWT